MIVKSYRLAFNCNMWHPTKHDWLLVASFIQQEEKERIGKFHFKRDAKCAMAGRLLITNFITTVTGLPWSDIKIDRSIYYFVLTSTIVLKCFHVEVFHYIL